MTSRDDENDEGVADLTPEDEQAVADLLASLPATPMPPEVLVRIEAALAAEPALTATAGVTTLAAARDRRGTSRGPLVFRIAASLVAVVGLTALGVAFVNGGGSSSDGSGASTQDMAEGGTSLGGRVSGRARGLSGDQWAATAALGKTYTAADLPAQATALLSAATPQPAAAGGSTAASAQHRFAGSKRAAEILGGEQLVKTPSKLAACVRELTDGDGRTPLAVDTGRWDNQAALVIVMPADAAGGQRQVFVVKPTCGTVDDSSDILQVAFLDS